MPPGNPSLKIGSIIRQPSVPAQYVKPYVQTNKSDFLDAEAIAEAVQRPMMRFVPIIHL